RSGSPDVVVAAGVLHDTIEHGEITVEDLRRHFDRRVVGLVAAVSEDPALASYTDRKARLRAQVAAAGPDAGAVFAADRISRLRARRAAAARRRRMATLTIAGRRRFEHDLEGLRLVQELIPDHPLVGLFAFELGMAGEAA